MKPATLVQGIDCLQVAVHRWHSIGRPKPSDNTFLPACTQHSKGLPVQVTPEKRGQAKQMAYGLLYGIGMHALAKSMEVTPDQAQQLSDSFRRRIPTLV